MWSAAEVASSVVTCNLSATTTTSLTTTQGAVASKHLSYCHNLYPETPPNPKPSPLKDASKTPGGGVSISAADHPQGPLVLLMSFVLLW